MNKKFWKTDPKSGVVKIIQTKLIEFVESLGYRRITLKNGNYILVIVKNNIVTRTSEPSIVKEVCRYLKEKNEEDAREAFAKGVGTYIYGKKMDLIKDIELIDDKDNYHSSRFYFKNGFCEVTKNSIDLKSYSKLEASIWEDRIIQKDFNMPKDINGQFKEFCRDITGGCKERFKVFQSIIGYLLHRNKERGETKAIIFYDENMGQNGGANGGTGKTLVFQAIKQCRELVQFNGKEIKEGSWFKNQQIELTTDILLYDDLKKGFSIENFFPILTTGIEVEKKREQAFTIDFSKSPKVAITSNYVVAGPGGSSDERRRYEFQVSNVFDAKYRPEDKYGCRFFNKQWPASEWNKFYLFMMECVQVYLEYGQLVPAPQNLNKSKVVSQTSKEFYEFVTEMINLNEWNDKRVFEELFKETYSITDLSPHTMSKWLQNYANEIDGSYEVKSSGGKYEFIIRKEEQGDGEGNKKAA